ncbi:MAG: Flp pilus assembly protein CpaB [Gemmobacter sp.]
MKLTSILVTILGLAVAGGSAQLAREMMSAPPAVANLPQGPEMVSVYAARSEIRFGDPIEAHKLVIQAWPKDAVPPGAFTSLDALVAKEGEPRRARRAIGQGELVLDSKVSAFGEKVTIVQRLNPNARAMAIKVDAETAVGGFVTPGDFVDVVLTQGRDGNMTAYTILQNIRVIGVDQTSDELRDQPGVARTITVEVTAEQGQRLALAQRAGALSLTLRTPDSDDNTVLDVTRLNDLLNEIPQPVAVVEGEPAPVTRRPTITVRRGITAEQVQVGN